MLLIDIASKGQDRGFPFLNPPERNRIRNKKDNLFVKGTQVESVV